MLNKVRIHQFFYLILSLFLIFVTQRNTAFNIADINSSLAILFLIIMSLGVSHGAADSIVIWKTFPRFKLKALAFLIYLLIVFFRAHSVVSKPHDRFSAFTLNVNGTILAKVIFHT